MTGFFFAAPAGLWGLAAAAAGTLVLYLFYRRHRPQKVTGLFLWGTPRRSGTGGRRAEKPLLGRSFLLDMTAAALLGLALAAPAWKREGALPAVIILDGSFSMRARGADAAAAEAALALASGAGGEGGAVILAGDTPRVLRAPGRYSAAETAAVLGSYLPASPSSGLAAAAALASRLYGPALDLHIFTNRNAALPPPGEGSVTVHIFPGQGGNLAFSQAWREPDVQPSRERVTAFAVNHSDGTVRAVFRIYAGAEEKGGILHESVVELSPRGRQSMEALLTLTSHEILTLSLSAGPEEDVIADDSRLQLPPDPVAPPTYLVEGLSAAASRYFELALEAAGCVPAPWETEGVPPPDLLVTPDPARRGAALTMEVPPENEPQVFLPPYVVDTAHPLIRDVSLSAVPWIAAAADAPHDPAETYIMSGGTPLYWRSRSGRLHLNLLADRCLIVNDPAWPVLMANLAAAAAERRPGLRRSAFRPGEMLRYRSPPDRRAGGLTFIQGSRRLPAYTGRGAAVPESPGLYRLTDEAGEIGIISVLPFFGAASDASDLAPAAAEIRTASTAAARTDTDLTWLFLFAAAAVLAVHWYLLDRNGE